MYVNNPCSRTEDAEEPNVACEISPLLSYSGEVSSQAHLPEGSGVDTSSTFCRHVLEILLNMC